MNLEKLRLFETTKEIVLFFIFIIFLFSTNLYNEYKNYQKFSSKKFYDLEALVLNQYTKTKRNRSYWVLKLKAKDGGYSFYSTNYEDIRDLRGRDLRLTVVTKNISFMKFLKSFYVPSFNLELLPKKSSIKESISTKIESMHENPLTKELFGALFLAKPISKELRAKISNLGISHLLAISGYHLGFLSLMLFLVLKYIYHPFHINFFPYRNSRFDLGIIVMALLFAYMSMLEYPISMLRSFGMMIALFFLLIRHIRVISFETLGVVVLLLIALYPRLLFSVAFWFSVSGIFYIYLFLYHFKNLKGWKLALVLNFWVFWMMLPIVHYIFDKWTPLQLLSPFLTIGFALFYPIELLLHLVGYGGILDEPLITLLNMDTTIYHLKSATPYLVLFVLTSLLAIRYRAFLWLSLGLVVILFI